MMKPVFYRSACRQTPGRVVLEHEDLGNSGDRPSGGYTEPQIAILAHLERLIETAYFVQALATYDHG
ncbi:MAG TPA: hypothetical protein VNY78_01270 [Edaphobacter sp.]|nr:hypothetical protein [Edaphobacter sp.]